MNLIHRWYCKSDGWAEGLRRYIIPWTLGEADLGDSLLEVGPGPGLSTDWLRERVPAMTAIEVDHKLAAALTTRMSGTNVKVIDGDGTAMPFEDASFSSAVCFTMLHHVPSTGLQDRLLAEAFRVLRPGASFYGSDSTISLRWRLFHVFDTCVPIVPKTLAARLEGAGFSDVVVDHNERYRIFRFQATKPGEGLVSAGAV